MRQLCIVTGGAIGIGEGIVRCLHDDVSTRFIPWSWRTARFTWNAIAAIGELSLEF